ncbi:MAG: histidine kinase [Methanomicrobiales archaeon HGW-Methanomicrobiales-1]|jgi:signal transduction histidine kinase|nr:MAG: histidine kinase [Methanomicrobiales archaeon HGW-Methanomicrobiales-1]
MKMRYLLPILLVIIVCIITAGCSQSQGQKESGQALPAAPTPKVSAAGTTPAELTTLVNRAVAYARENGKEKALAAFNDPNGPFVQGEVYVFSESYDGTALAEPFHHELVGTNIRDLTDRYGVPIVRNLAETARYGTGYVSYDYPNPKNNNRVEPKLSVVSDVDGTYYVGAGTYAGSGMVYPSAAIGPATRAYTVADLTAFVKQAAAYARANGKEKAVDAFNDPAGQFADGELSIMAVDFNGTVIASSLSPDMAKNRINLINYHDPDGVPTIREMRDLARHGGGFSYTVATVTKNGKTFYAPKIDYAEPVDDEYWIFSGIIIPEYEQLRAGNLKGIVVRNHTRTEMYDLVDRAVTYAKVNGKEKTLAEINNPAGQFVNTDLFVWAETFDGTILADPFWKDGIGKNFLNYTDPYGSMTTVVGINAISNGTGFSHAMFPDTVANHTASVPKLVYMKPVDDTWWIGSGIYGVQVK